MTWFKCSVCGHTIHTPEQYEKPPDLCPSCSNKCSWKDVTDYTRPGQDRIDPRL